MEYIVTHTCLQTRQQISELFSSFLKARRGKISWYQFQKAILENLLAAEAAFLETKTATKQCTRDERPVLERILDEYRERMTLIRRLGDAMAWEVMGYNRDYIDTYRRNSPPGLITGKIGSQAEQVLAELMSDESSGAFVLLHDITNCLRVGDLTIVRRGEKPLLVEVKMSERGMASDRAQRQWKRMQRLSEYLATGVGEVDPGMGTQFLIPVRATDSYNWRLIEEVGQYANTDGLTARDEQGIVVYLGVNNPEQIGSQPDEIAKALIKPNREQKPIFRVASLHRNALFAFRLIPIFCWGIDPRITLAVTFQDIAILTCVDVAALETRARSHGVSVFGPCDYTEPSRTVHRLLLEGWSLRSFDQQAALAAKPAKKVIRSYYRQEGRLKE